MYGGIKVCFNRYPLKWQSVWCDAHCVYFWSPSMAVDWHWNVRILKGMFQSIHYQRHEMFAVNMVYVVCHITLVKHLFVFVVFLYLCVCIFLYLMHNLCIDIFLYFVWHKICALKALPSIQYLLCVTQHLWNSLLHRWQQMSKNWLPSRFLMSRQRISQFQIPCSAVHPDPKVHRRQIQVHRRPKSTGGKSKFKFTSRIRSCPRPPRGDESSDWSDTREGNPGDRTHFHPGKQQQRQQQQRQQ